MPLQHAAAFVRLENTSVRADGNTEPLAVGTAIAGIIHTLARIFGVSLCFAGHRRVCPCALIALGEPNEPSCGRRVLPPDTGSARLPLLDQPRNMVVNKTLPLPCHFRPPPAPFRRAACPRSLRGRKGHAIRARGEGGQRLAEGLKDAALLRLAPTGAGQDSALFAAVTCKVATLWSVVIGTGDAASRYAWEESLRLNSVFFFSFLFCTRWVERDEQRESVSARSRLFHGNVGGGAPLDEITAT